MPWGFAAAGVASGVAGAAASSAGGKKGSKQSRASEQVSRGQLQLAQQQTDMAKASQMMAMQQFNLTDPLRTQTTNIYKNFLNSGQTPGFLDLDPNAATTAQFAKYSIPQIQAQQADMRRTLLSQGVRGGQMQQALGQAGIQAGLQRAQNLQNFSIDDIMRQEQRNMDRTKIAQSLFGGAADYGVGGLTQSQQGMGLAMSGLGAAGGTMNAAAGNLNSLGAQRIAQNQQTGQALGSLAGKGLGYGASQYLPGYGAMNANKYGAGIGNNGGINYSGGALGLTGGR